jgi:hypothetical protein
VLLLLASVACLARAAIARRAMTAYAVAALSFAVFTAVLRPLTWIGAAIAAKWPRSRSWAS